MNTWNSKKADIVKRLYLENGPEPIAKYCKVHPGVVVEEALRQQLEKNPALVIKHCAFANLKPRIKQLAPSRDLRGIPSMYGRGFDVIYLDGESYEFVVFGLDGEEVIDETVVPETAEEGPSSPNLVPEKYQKGEDLGTSPSHGKNGDITSDTAAVKEKISREAMSPEERKDWKNIEDRKINPVLPGKGTKKLPWSDADIDFLRENYPYYSIDELAVELGRTSQAVEKMIKRHKIRKRKKPVDDVLENKGTATLMVDKLSKEGLNVKEMLTTDLDEWESLEVLNKACMELFMERRVMYKEGKAKFSELTDMLDVTMVNLNKLLSKRPAMEEKDKKYKLLVQRGVMESLRETRKNLTPEEVQMFNKLLQKANERRRLKAEKDGEPKSKQEE